MIPSLAVSNLWSCDQPSSGVFIVEFTNCSRFPTGSTIITGKCRVSAATLCKCAGLVSATDTAAEVDKKKQFIAEKQGFCTLLGLDVDITSEGLQPVVCDPSPFSQDIVYKHQKSQ